MLRHRMAFRYNLTRTSQFLARCYTNEAHGAPSMWQLPETYAATRAPIASAISFNPLVYSSLDYAACEKTAVWQRSWFAAEHTQALAKAGDIVVVDIMDQSFILTRDKKGQFHAFHNVCSHRGAKLCSKNMNTMRLNCPYHKWSYNVQGQLRAAPHFERESFNKDEHGLKPVKLEVKFGIIWLNLDLDAPGLLDSLGGGPKELEQYPFSEMDLVGRQDYTPECNWKLLAENFVEWYHIPGVHPALDKFSKPTDHLANQGDGKYVGFVTSPLSVTDSACDANHWNLSPGLEEVAKAAPCRFDPNKTAYFYHLFPNVSITIYPHSVYTLIMLPGKDPSTSFEKLSFLMHPKCRLEGDDTETFERKQQEVYNFVKDVNKEDMEICELVAKGVRQSSYSGGMFCPEHEWTTYRFQNLMADTLTGAAIASPAGFAPAPEALAPEVAP